MHIVADQKKLLATLTKCLPFADKRGTLPTLANFTLTTKASAEGGAVQVCATDLYLAVTDYCPCQIKEAGAIALEARALRDRVANMPEGDVAIQVTDGKATIRSVASKRRYTLATLDAAEMPKVPEAKGADWLTLSAPILSELINTTSYAISPDVTRLHLNSAQFEVNGSKAEMTATCGHRLAHMELPIDPPATDPISILIPLRGVQELRRILPDEGDVRLAEVGGVLFVEHGDTQVSIKLTTADYPPWHQLLRELSPKVVRANRIALHNALKAVSVSASERTGGVKLTIGKSKLRVESESPDTGQGFDELDVEHTAGVDLTIGFNSVYLMQALSALTADEVIIGLDGELDPAQITVDGSGYLGLAMPLRL